MRFGTRSFIDHKKFKIRLKLFKKTTLNFKDEKKCMQQNIDDYVTRK